MLSGRVFAVTGANRGIGRSIVQQLVERGAQVAALDIVPIDPTLYDAQQVLTLVCDVTDEHSVVAAFGKIMQHFDGQLDGLVNNAGVILEKPLSETTMADFDRVVAVNLRGPFLCGKVALEHVMGTKPDPKDPFRIVNVASELAHIGLANYSAYAASKGGIFSMTRSWALEYAPYVLVNALAPGPTDTPMLQSESNYKQWQQGQDIPLGRLGTSEEVARGVCFLLGPDSIFMTGSIVDVNGGAAMY